MRDLRRIRDEVRKTGPDLVVLNGDIFEGKYSAGSREKIVEKLDGSADEIRKLLDTMVRANPQSQLLFIFGNHDAFHEVRGVMEKVQSEYPGNVKLEDAYAKVGDTLFLHGDLPLHVASHTSHKQMLIKAIKGELQLEPGELTREPKPHEEAGESHWKHVKEHRGMDAVRTKVRSVFYGAIDNIASRLLYPLDDVSMVIRQSLEQHDAQQPEDEKLLPGLKRIAIGHIHSPHNSRHQDAEGVELVVTGPSTRFGKSTILEFEFNDKGGLDNFQTFGCRHIGQNCR